MMRSCFRWFVSVGLLAAQCGFAFAREDRVDFATQVKPILESACLHCHCEDNAEGELRLDSRMAAIQGGESGTPSLVPGEPDASPLLTSMLLAPGDDLFMPPEEPALHQSQTDLIRQWIEQGAQWPASVSLEIQPRIDFKKHVQPILERNCVSCHRGEDAEGGYDLTTKAAALESGSEPSIVAFAADESSLYTLTTLSKDDDQLMPPSDSGGPLKKNEIESLRLWINQGAIWPDGVTLKPRAKIFKLPEGPDTLELVRRIREKIISNQTTDSGDKSYQANVPLTGAAYEMVAVPGGEFLMGSPTSEKNRADAEGPQTKVAVKPFWIGKYEVTWDEYEPFMITQVDRRKDGAREDYDPAKHSLVDAVSQPTGPYTEMSFGMGQKGYPAISMTQHAASKYCQWLSAQTGHYYRLPTEAEWEYACRAGTATAYSFGDSPAKIGLYGWYYENANEKYQKVGKKKPNAWGIHDMHGNVSEWTLDQFAEDYFSRIANASNSPFVRPETLYPRTVRGGNWDDDAENLRSARRLGSHKSWKQQDPQLPKSIWYHTNAQWLGFRVVRPKEIPSAEEMYFLWNSAKGKL
ncbi:SUMF1/EgtB/PvdO family nonheme iron enzyme [Planctomycetota bacterium]